MSNKLYMQSEDLLVANYFKRHEKEFNQHLKYFRYIYYSFFANILFIALFIFNTLNPHYIKYYNIDNKENVASLTGINSPIESDTEVGSWVTNALIHSLTFNFNNYQEVENQSTEYFTKNGWSSFIVALNNSKIIDSVVNNKYIINSVPTNAPIMVSKGLLNGNQAWKYQIPLTVTFISTGNLSRSNNYLITVLITRVPTATHPSGLGIEQFKEE